METLADRLMSAWSALRVDDIRAQILERPRVLRAETVEALEVLDQGDRAWVHSLVDGTHGQRGSVLELVDLRARGVI